jgi:hypothetical protein
MKGTPRWFAQSGSKTGACQFGHTFGTFVSRSLVKGPGALVVVAYGLAIRVAMLPAALTSILMFS